MIEKAILLASPFVLIGSMLWAFRSLTQRFGYPRGYLISFLIYWLGWCILFPAALLGGFRALIDLFQPAAPLASLDWKTQALLWWPVIFPLFLRFFSGIRKANARILVVSVLLGIVIGITEEILWRGAFLRIFPQNLWLGILYPSVFFGLWHICPQSVVKNQSPGGVYSFVIYSIVLGLSYAFAAHLAGSIFWPTVSHIIHDTVGLGGFAYANLFRNR